MKIPEYGSPTELPFDFIIIILNLNALYIPSGEIINVKRHPFNISKNFILKFFLSLINKKLTIKIRNKNKVEANSE